MLAFMPDDAHGVVHGELPQLGVLDFGAFGVHGRGDVWIGKFGGHDNNK